MKTPLEPAASRKLGISELLGNSGFLNQRVMQEIGSTYTAESTAGEYAGEFLFTSGRNAGPEARRLALELDKSRDPKPTRPTPESPTSESERIGCEKPGGSAAAPRRAQQPNSPLPPSSRRERRMMSRRAARERRLRVASLAGDHHRRMHQPVAEVA